MAQVGINVRVDVEGNATRGLDKVEGETQRLKRQIMQLEKATRKAQGGNKSFQRGLKSMQRQMKSTKNAVRSLNGVVTGMAAVFAGGLMVDAIREGAAFDAKLSSLGDNAVEVKKRLQSLQVAIGKTFSLDALATAESKIRAFGLELELTPQILTAVESKAAKMGITTDYALDSMITALARSSSKWLDNLGIVIKAGDANKAWAESNNRNVRSMTAAEKQAAFTSAAIKELTSDTSVASQGYRDAARIQAELDDAMMELKQTMVGLAPAMIPVVKALAQVAIGIGDVINLGLEALGLAESANDRAIKRAGGSRVSMDDVIKQFAEESSEKLRRDVPGVTDAEVTKAQADFVKETIRIMDAVVKVEQGGGGDIPSWYFKRVEAIRKARNRLTAEIGKQRQMDENARAAMKARIDAMAGRVGKITVAGSGADLSAEDAAKQQKKREERDHKLEMLRLEHRLSQQTTETSRIYVSGQIERAKLLEQYKDLGPKAEKLVLEMWSQGQTARYEANEAEIEQNARKQAIEDAKAQDQKIVQRLKIEMLGLELKLASTTTDQERLKLEHQMQALDLQSEAVKLTEEEARLRKEIQDRRQEKELKVEEWERFGGALGAASANMATMSPGLANVLSQMQDISKTAGDAGIKSAETGKAALKGGAAVALGFVEDEETKAGIMAAMESALAIAAFASGNIAGGIGHTVAAGMFAKIAGEGAPAAAAPQGGGGGGGGGGQVVVNFGSGIVLGTPQDVGRAIYDATDSTMGTGMTTGKV